MLRLVQERE